MFKKTQRKIVFAIVFSLLILMAVTLSVIYLSNRIALRHENEAMLEMYVERYTLDSDPAEPKPDPGKPSFKPSTKPDEDGQPPDHIVTKRPDNNEPAFRASTFYSVAYGGNDEVLVVRNGNEKLQSEESLIETASAILSRGKQSGSAGNMMYLVAERDGYTLVAMIDKTITDNSQKMLIRQMLLLGSLAMAVLFVLSIFIARRIVRPLEENDRRQKRFISDAGHELKTPIAVISANSELLQREIGSNEWLANIDYENERMSALVKQLLQLSRAENGELLKETVAFSTLVSGEILPFESYAFEKGCEIVSEITPDLTVTGNSMQLRQLVSILLDNAVAHGIAGEIHLTLQREKHTAVLSVSNAANNIGTEQLPHLFERFYRTDESRTDDGAHYGLGLSIAKAVVDAHGGTIYAEYKNGRAVFTAVLPLQ